MLTNRQDIDLRELMCKIATDNGRDVTELNRIITPLRDVDLVSCAIIIMYKAKYSPSKAVETLIDLEIDSGLVAVSLISADISMHIYRKE